MSSNLRSLEYARELDAAGLTVLPAIPRGKRPAVDWRQFQAKRTTPHLAAWFGGSKAYNYWILCGQASGVVVLDCDNDAAVEFWRKRLGSIMDETTCVKTAKGFHWWFRVKGPFASWSSAPDAGDDQPRFDVRGDGTGVIAPPSVHESGHVYAWVRGLAELRDAPQSLREGAPETAGPPRPATPRGLSALLERVPQKSGEGRNTWLTAVAGHLAKWVPYEDAFDSLLEVINSSMDEPLPDEEVKKIEGSIWTKESENGTASAEETGWLKGTGTKLLTILKDGGWTEWANFDIKCEGIVISDENDYRAYWVDVLTEDRPASRDLLEPGILGAPARFQIWLASHGVNVVPPPADSRKGSVGSRIQRYLESQDAPVSRAAPWLGYNEGHGFITHEGVITPQGLLPHSGVIPHPRLRGWAPYKYGFVGEEEARRVLNEVLTFQEEELCSVFGSWWAACFLKGAPAFGTSLWPYVALEAPSESGKTRGFFSLMIALTGNTEGHGESTTAALRDKVSAHRNGPVWIDDLSDVQAIGEILRQATSEGVRTKKGLDRTTQESVRLVAPIVVSGESMGAILTEKAQRDRAIQLVATSPVHRRSLHSDRPQWDDIQDLLRSYDGDLTRVAGTLASMALSSANALDRFRDLRGEAGRHNDKIGVLRVGARVLAAITGDSKHIGRVDEWCARQLDLGQENVLTTKILPTMLTGIVQQTPVGGPAVFVRHRIVYFNEAKLAEEWGSRWHQGDRNSLASLGSIRAQRIALGIGGDGQRFSILGERIRGTTDQLRRYHSLDKELSELVLSRANWVIKEDGPDEAC